MDLTDSQVNTALQEAFTCYLAFLSHTQTHHESRLPHRGKGVETTSDLSTHQYFKSRVVATEACLRYTEKITRRILRWITDPHEETTGFTEDVEYPSLNLENFLPDSDESPFLDPLSGEWIQPKTAFSAGPSNSSDESKHHISPCSDSHEEEPTKVKTEVRTKSVSTTDIESAPLEPKPPNTKPSPDQYDSTSSSIEASTPPSTISSFPEFSDDESSDDEISAEESSDEEVDETTSTKSEQATAFYKIPQCEVDDEAYARLIYSEEQKRVCELDESFAQAQKLAAEWEQEQKSLLRDQEAYAKKVEKKEKEEAARVERDRKAAREAEQQIRWELEAITRETEAMREEERQRREVEEEKKAQERERKLKIEREKRWAAEMEEKQRAVREENRRRDEDLLRRQREKARKEAEEKRKAFALKADCISCMGNGDRKDMLVLQCKHVYCGECIAGAFKSALKSRSPFKCCRFTVPITLATPHISKSTIQTYTLMLLELSTKKPKYCSSKSCHRFIPPANIKGPIAICPKCMTKTCISCMKKEHSGVCREDKEGKAVKALAEKKGWKSCPRCSQVVERTEGCLHMTCRCRAEWCYSCLRDWTICNSTCGRE